MAEKESGHYETAFSETITRELIKMMPLNSYNQGSALPSQPEVYIDFKNGPSVSQSPTKMINPDSTLQRHIQIKSNIFQSSPHKQRKKFIASIKKRPPTEGPSKT